MTHNSNYAILERFTISNATMPNLEPQYQKLLKNFPFEINLKKKLKNQEIEKKSNKRYFSSQILPNTVLPIFYSLKMPIVTQKANKNVN